MCSSEMKDSTNQEENERLRRSSNSRSRQKGHPRIPKRTAHSELKEEGGLPQDRCLQGEKYNWLNTWEVFDSFVRKFKAMNIYFFDRKYLRFLVKISNLETLLKITGLQGAMKYKQEKRGLYLQPAWTLLLGILQL